MEDTSSFSKVYGRMMTGWLCRLFQSAQSGVSHTKVQVLSGTHHVPPKADSKRPSPEKVCETWARRIKPTRLEPKNYPGSKKAVIRTGNLVNSEQDHGVSIDNTINQSERALRQFARICRGPVPLSKSGQTKAEAIASLSRLVQQQTRHISEEVSNVFSESYQIFQELDLLREKQDRVEDFLEKELRRVAGAEVSRSSSRSSTITPRRVSRQLTQREIDKDLANRYMEYRVKSTDLFEVMSTIDEDKIFHLHEIQEEEERDFSEFSEDND